MFFVYELPQNLVHWNFFFTQSLKLQRIDQLGGKLIKNVANEET